MTVTERGGEGTLWLGSGHLLRALHPSAPVKPLPHPTALPSFSSEMAVVSLPGRELHVHPYAHTHTHTSTRIHTQVFGPWRNAPAMMTIVIMMIMTEMMIQRNLVNKDILHLTPPQAI